MTNLINRILNIYIVILTFVPTVYTFIIIRNGIEIRNAQARGEGVMGDCSGITTILIPFFLVISILTIAGIVLLKKSTNRNTLRISTILIGLFPISVYVIFTVVVIYLKIQNAIWLINH